jgi:Ribbon-helix-helix domain
MGKTKRKLHSVYLDPDKHELFMKLSQKSRIAQAVLLREAVDDLLKKYGVADRAVKDG